MNVEVVFHNPSPLSLGIMRGRLASIGSAGLTVETFGDTGPAFGLWPGVREITWGNVTEIRIWDRNAHRAGDVLYDAHPPRVRDRSSI